jgi:hypothetical protein
VQQVARRIGRSLSEQKLHKKGPNFHQ